MTEESESIVKPVSTEELEQSFSIPSSTVNQFFVHIGSLGVRIAFAEQVPHSEKRTFRSSVTMSRGDAKELYQLLQAMLNPPAKQESDRLETELGQTKDG